MYELFRPDPLPLLSAGHAAPGPYFGARMGRQKRVTIASGGRLILSAGGWGSGMNSLTAMSDERAPRGFARFGRADSERAFRVAVRHSRHVRILRVAIPLTAIIALVTGVAFAFLLNPMRMLSGMPVDVGRMVVSGTKIMMHQPRLAGVTRDNRRYDMVAQAAAQDLTKPDMVELQGIRATMEMRDKVTFETTAKAGLYNTKTEQLTLNQNIVVTSSSGYQAFLNEASVDVRASKIASDKPVEVKTATWTINANGMEVSEAGDLVRFDRGVFVTLLLDNTTSGAGGGARKR
jgi:lipopolysaccharide export system protein LptC